MPSLNMLHLLKTHSPHLLPGKGHTDLLNPCPAQTIHKHFVDMYYA